MHAVFCVSLHIPWNPALTTDAVPALGSHTTLAITPHKRSHMDEEQEREEIRNV